MAFCGIWFDIGPSPPIRPTLGRNVVGPAWVPPERPMNKRATARRRLDDDGPPIDSQCPPTGRPETRSRPRSDARRSRGILKANLGVFDVHDGDARAVHATPLSRPTNRHNPSPRSLAALAANVPRIRRCPPEFPLPPPRADGFDVSADDLDGSLRGCLPRSDPTLNPHIAWYRKSKPVSRVR